MTPMPRGKKPEDLCKPPGLWLEAFKVATEERKMKFKELPGGFKGMKFVKAQGSFHYVKVT